MPVETGREKPWDATLATGLAAGRTIKAAAAEAGIHERTARRRLEDRAFRERVRTLRAETYAQAAGVLAESATRAAETLRDLLDSEREETRLAAARAILEHATKARDSIDLEERLSELEAYVEALEAERAARLKGAA